MFSQNPYFCPGLPLKFVVSKSPPSPWATLKFVLSKSPSLSLGYPKIIVARIVMILAHASSFLFLDVAQSLMAAYRNSHALALCDYSSFCDYGQ